VSVVARQPSPAGPGWPRPLAPSWLLLLLGCCERGAAAAAAAARARGGAGPTAAINAPVNFYNLRFLTVELSAIHNQLTIEFRSISPNARPVAISAEF
jgi:hypothetical protein